MINTDLLPEYNVVDCRKLMELVHILHWFHMSVSSLKLIVPVSSIKQDISKKISRHISSVYLIPK